MDDNRKNRNKGFAFVTYESSASAAKAIDAGEVIMEFATVNICESYKRPQRQEQQTGFSGSLTM